MGDYQISCLRMWGSQWRAMGSRLCSRAIGPWPGAGRALFEPHRGIPDGVLARRSVVTRRRTLVRTEEFRHGAGYRTGFA